MRPRGRRVALAAAVLGLTTIALAAFLRRGRIEEEWHIRHFQKGDLKADWRALEWMESHGAEASWLVLGETAMGGVDIDGDQCLKIQKKIELRFGPARLDAAIQRVLERKAGSDPFRVHVASRLMSGKYPGSFTPSRIELAMLRLREGLSDPKGQVRSISVYGLANAGERARSLVPAIEPLKNDPIKSVREAAVFAIERLQSLGAAEASPATR